jgi:hypothetical protein
MNPELVYEVAIECNWEAAQVWCDNNVGKFNVDWYKLGIDPAAIMFDDHKTYWYFKNEKDVSAFLLRWT